MRQLAQYRRESEAKYASDQLRDLRALRDAANEERVGRAPMVSVPSASAHAHVRKVELWEDVAGCGACLPLTSTRARMLALDELRLQSAAASYG